jgi:hypothetical protein
VDASTRRRYLDIVRRHLSDGALVQPPRLLGGNDHDLLVVGDRLAFRFPKRPRPIDRRRERFLERLAPRSPLPLPLIEAHRDPVTGIEYEVNAFIL